MSCFGWIIFIIAYYITGYLGSAAFGIAENEEETSVIALFWPIIFPIYGIIALIKQLKNRERRRL